MSEAAKRSPPAESLGSVVYVAGYGRSGSTVLDGLLGTAPGTFGMGEVAVLFDIVSRPSGTRARCTCSRRLHDCPIWGEVLARVERDWNYGDLMLAAEITRRQDTAGIGSSHSATSARRAYGELWSLVLKTVQECTGARVLVDSSKTAARRSSTRPLRIAQTTPLGVFVIHLIRDPAGVAWSVMKGSNRRLERGDRNARDALPVTRSMVGRYRANRHARHALQHIDGMTLRYEDLCRDPASAVTAVSAFVGFDADPVLDRLREGDRFGGDHGVSGNRIRRAGFAGVAIDDEWRHRLPVHARVAANLFRLIDRRVLT